MSDDVHKTMTHRCNILIVDSVQPYPLTITEQELYPVDAVPLSDIASQSADTRAMTPMSKNFFMLMNCL